jgi:hypothetical protein
MYLRTRDHNRVGGSQYGPGGPRCTCCGPAPKDRDAERRRVRRAEKRAWRKEWDR